MTMKRYGLAIVVAIGGCFTASVPPMSPGASSVEIRKGDPPPHAVELGPIEAENGTGCGGLGAKGTFEGAMVELRNLAADRGADYVMLVSQSEPHQELSCYDNHFVVRGIAYRISPQPAHTAPPVARAAAAPTAVAAPTAAASVASTAAAAPAAAASCDPPCSPGYRCSQAVCLAVCNPACGPAQLCRQDRTCAAASPLAESPSSTAPLPPPPAPSK